MDKADRASGTQKKTKKSGRSPIKWILIVFFSTIVISASFSTLSAAMLDGSSIFTAMVILLAIILVGIAFDIVGVAVTAAEERPLHSMAAKKVPGAREAITLIKQADRVSSICNDVVGDICGVISGSASAVIAVQLLESFTISWSSVVNMAMSAMVAGLTVGGKAIGKGLAMRYSVAIVHFVGRLTALFKKPFSCKKRKNKKPKCRESR